MGQKNHSLLTVLALLLMPLALNHGADYRASADPSQDFGAYASFGWLHRPPAAPDQEKRNPVLDRIFREEVAAALEARGLAEKMDGDIDLLLIYYVDPRGSLATYSAGYTVGGHTDGWLQPQKIYKEKKSVVVIDAVDGASFRLVWRGSFAVSLAEPWVMARRIRKAARQMVRRIPVPSR